MSKSTSPEYNLFFNKGKKWSTEDDSMLTKMYEKDDAKIKPIAIHFGRTVGSVISRLMKNGAIPRLFDDDEYIEVVKGYQEYLNDVEYRDYEKPIKIKPLLQNKDKNNVDMFNSLKSDIEHIKKQVDKLS